MKEVVAGKNLIAYCGLYCGACKSYLLDKCPGCAKNEKASWCKLRECCISNKYLSCADCTTVKDVRECKKTNNFISKTISFFTGSDRPACINFIREKGYEAFAAEMSSKKLQSIKKKKVENKKA